MGRKRVYRRNGNWYVDFTNHAGKRVRKMLPEAKSKGQAEELLADSMHEESMIRRGYADALNNSARVVDLLDAFLLHKLATRRYDTAVFYSATLANILGRLKTPEGKVWPPPTETPADVVRGMARTFEPGALAVTCVDQITPECVEVYVEARRAEVAVRTLNAAVSALKTLLAWGVRAGRIKSNPLATVSSVGKPARCTRALDVDEIHTLLDVSPEPYRTIWLAFVSTGMRRRELVRLCWPQVDFATETIRILPETSKSKRQRDVPMVPELCACLRAMRAEAKDADGYVFTNQDGKPWVNNLLRRFTRCARLALVGKAVRKDGVWHMVYRDDGREVEEPLPGVKGWKMANVELDRRRGQNAARVTIHTLRHTFATQLLLAGCNPKVVSDLLGHSGIQVTLDIYGHVFPRNKQEAVAKLPFGGTGSDRKGHPRGTDVKMNPQLKAVS